MKGGALMSAPVGSDHLVRRVGGLVGHVLGSAGFVLLVDPYAVLVAVVGAWLLALSIAGVARYEGHVLTLSLWLVFMILVTALSAAHVMITAVAGWGSRDRSAD